MPVTRVTTVSILVDDGNWVSFGSGSINQTLGSGDSDGRSRDQVGALPKRLIYNMTQLEPGAVGRVKHALATFRIRYTGAAHQLDLVMRYNGVDESVISVASPPASFTTQTTQTVLDAPSSTPWKRKVANATAWGLAADGGSSDGSSQDVADMLIQYVWERHPGATIQDVIGPLLPVGITLGQLVGAQLMRSEIPELAATIAHLTRGRLVYAVDEYGDLFRLLREWRRPPSIGVATATAARCSP